MKLCIIIPVLNEEKFIQDHLNYFISLNKQANVIFVDGQSTDNTIPLLRDNQLNFIQTNNMGRGAQLYAGLVQADSYEGILFLHADTLLPENYLTLIQDALRTYQWGRFDIRINSSQILFRVIETLMNLRSYVTGIATGDQAIFVHAGLANEKLSCLADYPLMEDIYISKTLKTVSRPARIQTPVITSSRYWEKRGIVKTILSMWYYRLLFFLGVSPEKLYRSYYS